MPAVSILRQSGDSDLSAICSIEGDEDTKDFVGRWSFELHSASLTDPDVAHLVVMSPEGDTVGFLILLGLTNPHKSIELKRIAIREKGRGYGRGALRAVKALAFNQLGAHRLWLDVKDFNDRARTLYRSEGFVEEGVLRDAVSNGDGYESLVVMSMLEAEYRSES